MSEYWTYADGLEKLPESWAPAALRNVLLFRGTAAGLGFLSESTKIEKTSLVVPAEVVEVALKHAFIWVESPEGGWAWSSLLAWYERGCKGDPPPYPGDMQQSGRDDAEDVKEGELL